MFIFISQAGFIFSLIPVIGGKKLKNHIVLLCFITISALFLRIGYIGNTVVYNPIAKDASQYVIYGYNLAFYKTFSQEYPSENPAPDSFRSPGYPTLISLFFLLNGKDYYLPLLYTQAVISTLLVPLTFMLGSLFLATGWAMAAAIFVAFSPHLVSMSGYVLTEILFCFMLLSSFLCFCYGIRQSRPMLMAEAAVLFGLTYLTNETAMLIPFLISAPILIRGREFRKIGIFLLIFSLFPMGWSIRETRLPPDAPRGRQRAISTMVHGSYPGFIYKSPKHKYFPYHEDPQQAEYSSSFDNFRRIWWQRFSERPVRYLSWYLFEKPYYLWTWNILQGQGDIYIYGVITSLYKMSPMADATRLVMKFLHPIMMMIALIGIAAFYVRYRRSDYREISSDIPIYILMLCVYYTLIYTVFLPDPRYSVPLRPYFYLWVVWTIQTAYSGIKRLKS